MSNENIPLKVFSAIDPITAAKLESLELQNEMQAEEDEIEKGGDPISKEALRGVFEAMGQGFNPDLEVEKLQQTTRELIQKHDVDKFGACEDCGRWSHLNDDNECAPCVQYYKPKELVK